MASLTIVVDGVEQKFPLDNPVVTLGRGLESDIRLKDIKASRRHCQIQKTPRGYQCSDLSSGNGTFVNGVQIKTQQLDAGDKIQIGSTIITFVDAAKPSAATGRLAAVARAAAAPPPVASPPAAGSSSKTATAKIPAAQVPVVPTRRTTARAEAPRASSKQLPKVSSSAAMRKSTGRVGAARPSKPIDAPAPPKGGKGLRVAIAIGVAAAIAAGGYFAFGTRDNGDALKVQVEQILKKGREAEAAEKLDAALQEYQKALDLCQGDRLKSRAAEIRRLIQQIQSRKESNGSAPPPSDAPNASGKGADLQARRAEIAERHKLAGDAADWSGALKEWKDYLARRPGAESEPKVQAEIKTLLDRAREDLARIRKKADALAQENKGAEAVAHLKQQLPRFQNSELAAELDAAIKQYDK